MNHYKISILEKNGIDFDVPTEADADTLMSSIGFLKAFEYVRSSDLIIENNKSLMIADTLILNEYNLIIEGNGILGVF